MLVPSLAASQHMENQRNWVWTIPHIRILWHVRISWQIVNERVTPAMLHPCAILHRNAEHIICESTRTMSLCETDTTRLLKKTICVARSKMHVTYTNIAICQRTKTATHCTLRAWNIAACQNAHMPHWAWCAFACCSFVDLSISQLLLVSMCAFVNLSVTRF